MLCDDPQIFFSQYFLKIKYSRVVLFIFVNFDVFTNKPVEWPKFALFYRSFWQVLDHDKQAGLTPVNACIYTILIIFLVCLLKGALNIFKTI